MKHIVTALLLASLCAFGMMAVAEKIETGDSREYGETMSQLILHEEQSVFTGLVIETDRGIAITTNRGTFPLKGTQAATLVGHNVRLRGVLRNGILFAVQVAN